MLPLFDGNPGNPSNTHDIRIQYSVNFDCWNARPMFKVGSVFKMVGCGFRIIWLGRAAAAEPTLLQCGAWRASRWQHVLTAVLGN